MANHPKKCFAVCVTGNFDLVDSGDCTCRRRNRADHVHRRLRDARRNAVAGEPLDQFLFSRRDGAALSHLRRQFEDPAERIYRACPIRDGLRLPRRRHADRFNFHLAQRETTETLIMVSLLEMPQTLSQQLPRQNDRLVDEIECAEIMIDVRDLDFAYGGNTVLHNVSLDIPDRAVTAFIGPSGCGKTTFLRCINRMNDTIDGARVSGVLELDGKNVYASDVDPVVLRSRVGMVFQKPNPFPKSIYDNVAYGPRIHGMVKSKRELDEIVEKSLRRAALWDEVKDRLHQSGAGLSGGQQQRLVIARTVAVNPEVILMDEPCSALDPIATARIEDLMEELRQSYAIVIVTHSMQQAARVSQRTAYFHLGDLIEVVETDRIFTHPRHKLTEDYITGRFG